MRYWEEKGSIFSECTLQVGERVLRSLTRRDPEVNTLWTIEHLLKDTDDAEAWLELPTPKSDGEINTSSVLEADAMLGDAGIVALDTPDPLCLAAQLFELGDYTIIALTEPELFRRLLDHCAAQVLPRVEAVAKALPGRMWRIYGPEYASPPYLPPRLFREYVVPYVAEMVSSIQRYGGFARVHCHGNINLILDDIAATGCMGLDPIEPPPQGDVQLHEVRKRVGGQMVLFGNLEASDLESLPLNQWKEKVRKALTEGTFGEGRGFVLMPSACPYGRDLAPQVLPNYKAMIEAVAG
jgi:uroporphyrinogen-III decarboxylase